MAKTEAEKEAAKAAKQAEKEAAKVDTSVAGIEVGDPLLLRPVELPLVVKPSDGGEWGNEAQAQYAKILNGYAYKNPEKWRRKKAKLVKNLSDLAENPDLLGALIGGGQGNLSYNNKLIS